MLVVELLSGLLAFGFFLLLWVILPHRLHRAQHSMVSRSEETTVRETPMVVAEEPPSRFPHQPEHVGASLRLRMSASPERRNGMWGVLEGEWGTRKVALPFGMERVRVNGALQERYTAIVGGLRCQHTAPYGLKEIVEEALQGLSYAGQLPLYSFGFLGPAGLQMAPVYRLQEWRVAEPEGPILSARDLRVLREHLADLWGCPAEAVKIYRLSEAMSWVPPLTVLSDFEGRLWVPVFLERGRLIYPHGLEERELHATPDSMWEALLVGLGSWIHEGCRIDMTEPLAHEIRGHESHDQLRGFIAQNGRLRPMTWPIYRYCEWWIALLDEDGEWTRGVLASDRESLQRLAGRFLVREGYLRDPAALRVIRET